MKYLPMIIMLAFALLTFRMNAAAQNSDGFPIPDNAQAIQFGISDNFSLRSFQGGVISYKYHLDSRHALRVGLSTNVGGSTYDQTGTSFNGDSISSVNLSTSENDEISLRVDMQFVWYNATSTSILIFYGAGPHVGYGRISQEQAHSYLGSFSSSSTSTMERTSWSIGATGICGVEWILSDLFSLHAEYTASLGFTKENFESHSRPDNAERGTENSGSSASWRFSNSSVNFGLSVYF
jgi:hypothetical protein